MGIGGYMDHVDFTYFCESVMVIKGYVESQIAY